MLYEKYFENLNILIVKKLQLRKIYGVINSECLVKPKDSRPRLVRIVIKIKLIMETSIANFNDLDFLYDIEIFISLTNSFIYCVAAQKI